MRQRCNNPNRHNYHRYGGRGITVCQEWDDFWQFVLDMGERPKGHTLDRIDNNGPYTPQNCRWANSAIQNRNNIRTRLITFKNKTQCITDWAQELNININTVWARLRRGWSVEKALFTPTKK